MWSVYLDYEDIEIVDALNVILWTNFRHILGVEEPTEVHLGVGVTVVENHVEELGGGLQRGLLVHLEANCAAVV